MRRCVVITGATKGIGAAVSRQACQQGWSVYLIARDRDRLKSMGDSLCREHGEEAVAGYAQLDLSDEASVASFCSSFDTPVHALVNNAGTWREDRLNDGQIDTLRELMELNVFGLAALSKGLSPRLPRGSRIVNISSQLGTSGRAGMGAYSATKHAVVGLTRCWALEEAQRGITVNAICPGWVNTESNRTELKQLGESRGLSLDEEMTGISAGLPLGRFVAEAEVASLTCFLLSDAASGISGQAYEIK